MAASRPTFVREQPRPLLERSADLAALEAILDSVRATRRGRLVLLAGEAGVGKTALLRRFCDERTTPARTLWGACDPLFTPRPLGPLRDIAEQTGGELERLTERGARPHEVLAALAAELRARAPAVLVLEDAHWSDEATLDLLTMMGRRVETASALVVVTHRDDELDRVHPLRLVLGELAGSEAIHRMRLAPLSREAVAALAEPYGMDAAELYRATAGNPFFVTEALEAGDDRVPATVRDAVLARAAHLGEAARGVLEWVAVAPPHVEMWLLETLAGDEMAHLEECLASAMLTAAPEGVAFRHELARRVIEEALPPDRAVRLHRAALAALAAPPAGEPELARLAHHAEAARDAEAVLRVAPAAAARAAALGAHREAAAQYARALRFADGLPVEERIDLLERRSHECYLTDQSADAIGSLEEALALRRELDDPRGEAATLSALSRRLWCSGRSSEAQDAGRRAIKLLEPLPPGRELALASANLSQLCLNGEDLEGAVTWGRRALELARAPDDAEIVVQALNNMGTAELLAGQPEGRDKLEQSRELAAASGLDEHVGRAFIHLGWAISRTRAYELAERIEAGIDECAELGLELWRLYMLAYRARLEIDRGRWSESLELADAVLRYPRGAIPLRILALVITGTVRARRGHPGPWEPLDEASALAEQVEELQFLWPVAAARAEAAWLEGDHRAVADATDAGLGAAIARRSAWVAGELACWRRRAGIVEEPPAAVAEPYALELGGAPEDAARRWRAMGCPYDAAVALAGADGAEPLRDALSELQRLGALPAAAIVARRLRRRGARGLPRGPRPTTRRNPAGLTARELEVLALVAAGLRNPEIGRRLSLSERTVAHHVSAILRKLGVRTRAQASAEAVRLGLPGHDR
jgi:DNA-binding CsgD family transcriptional regulator